MANSEEIKVIINADDKASGVLSNLGKTAGGLSGMLGGLGEVAGVAAVAGIGALAAGAVSSVKAFEESENAIAQLESRLKSTAGAAGVTKDDVTNFATALQKVSGISDEATIAAQTNLLTFTSIGHDVFPMAAQAAADMAAHFAGGIPTMEQMFTQTTLLGKALQDPVQGLGALKRVGVNVDELSKKFTEGMSIQEKQKLILQELAVEYGGAAEAAGSTFSGKLAILKESVNDLQETLGGAIVTAITPFIDMLSAWAQDPATQEQIEEIVAGFTNFATQMAPIIKDTLPAFISIMKFVGEAILAVSEFLFKDLPNALGTAIFWFTNIINKVTSFIKTIQNAINKMRELLDMTGGKITGAVSRVLGFGGGRAVGGPVNAGTAYMVGEKGPELFVPRQSGTIIPNGSGGGNIYVSVTGNFLSEDAAEKMGNLIMNRLKLQTRI